MLGGISSSIADEYIVQNLKIENLIDEKQDDDQKDIIVIVPEECTNDIISLAYYYKEDNVIFINEKNYINIREAFPYSWKINGSDINEPVLMIIHNGKNVDIPLGKKEITINGMHDTCFELPTSYIGMSDGITHIFVLKDAVDSINE